MSVWENEVQFLSTCIQADIFTHHDAVPFKSNNLDLRGGRI